MGFWTMLAAGVVVAVAVKPRQRRPGVAGVVSDGQGRARLALHVAAPAREGEANDAVRALLAETLGVSKGAVTILAGAGAREKRVYVAGDPARLGERLAALAIVTGDKP
jgi:uncharacterized protein YggU (UPF0235/DUF167 family)